MRGSPRPGCASGRATPSPVRPRASPSWHRVGAAVVNVEEVAGHGLPTAVSATTLNLGRAEIVAVNLWSVRLDVTLPR